MPTPRYRKVRHRRGLWQPHYNIAIRGESQNSKMDQRLVQQLRPLIPKKGKTHVSSNFVGPEKIFSAGISTILTSEPAVEGFTLDPRE